LIQRSFRYFAISGAILLHLALHLLIILIGIYNRIGFNLNKPFGLDNPRNLNNRAGRANISKEFAIHQADLLPVIDIRHVDPGSNVFYRICFQMSKFQKTEDPEMKYRS